MSDVKVKKRPVAKGVVLSFGLVSMSGDILSPKKAGLADAEAFKMACPVHSDSPHGVKQKYVCSEDATAWEGSPGETLRARVEDDTWVLVSKEAVDAARASELPPKTLELRSHPYDALATFALGNAYVFQPEHSAPFYAMLMEIVDEHGVVTTEAGPMMLVGLMSPRSNTELFVRIERWGNQLVIRELVRPEDIDTFDRVDASVDTKLLEMGKQLIVTQAEAFDPETYKASVRERIATLTEQAKAGKVPTKASTPSAPVQDLAALLQASLDAAKESKKAS